MGGDGILFEKEKWRGRDGGEGWRGGGGGGGIGGVMKKCELTDVLISEG